MYLLKSGMAKNYLLGADWGTSAFRLRLIELNTRQLIGEFVANEGIASTYQAWKAASEHEETDRFLFFRNQLQQHVEALSKKLKLKLDDIIIVLSGMASSSIGMEEVPYATLPFALDGSQSNFRYYAASQNFHHDILLISGVKSEEDVMRGEETELIGLLTLLQAEYQTDNAVFIFPGTHSKHLYLNDGQLINFCTFMTGEVFDLLSNFSILQSSVAKSNSIELLPHQVKAFQLGVKESVASNILNRLFSVRTNQLFQKLDKKQNFFYLSGLLIGSELQGLSTCSNESVVLCGGRHLFALYKLAMEALGLIDRVTLIPADVVDKAAFVGQMRIFQTVKI